MGLISDSEILSLKKVSVVCRKVQHDLVGLIVIKTTTIICFALLLQINILKYATT